MPPRIIGVAITCHNRKDTTLRCLESLFAQEPAVAEISVVLVDDGSGDGTAAAVAQFFPSVEILPADGRQYWSGGMILAQARLMAAQPDYLLWLNDDVVLDRDAIGQLLRTGAAISVGACRDPDGGEQSYGGQVRQDWHPFRFGLVPADGEARVCDTFHGNCVLVTRAAYEALGGIDDMFAGIQGMGDTDYGLRAKRAGIRAVQAGRSIGTCRRNSPTPAWADGRLSGRRRLSALLGPKGPCLIHYLRLARRHGGPAWPLLGLLPGVKAAAAFLRTRTLHQPLKVALFEGLFPSYRMGYLRHLARISDVECTVFHGQGLADGRSVAPAACGLPVRERWESNLFWPRGGGRLAWTGGVGHILLAGYDVALVFNHVHNLSVWALWLSRWLLGRPKLVINDHCRLDSGETFKGKLRRWMQLLQLRSADAILPYGYEGEAACRAMGIPKERLFPFLNAIDTERTAEAEATVTEDVLAALRQAHGLTPGQTLFLHLGRDYPAKRLDLGLAAIRLLRQDGRDCVLVVMGDGGEAIEDAALRRLGAEFDENRVAAWAKMSTAMLMADSVGLSCVHAFAYGLPLVSSAAGVGHGPEYAFARDGENALLVPTLEAAALAVALARLMDEPGLCDRLTAGCRETSRRLAMPVVAEAMAQSFRHAAGVGS